MAIDMEKEHMLDVVECAHLNTEMERSIVARIEFLLYY